MEERGGNLALFLDNQFEGPDRRVVSGTEIKTLRKPSANREEQNCWVACSR